jgi:hypothetical protein
MGPEGRGGGERLAEDGGELHPFRGLGGSRVGVGVGVGVEVATVDEALAAARTRGE